MKNIKEIRRKWGYDVKVKAYEGKISMKEIHNNYEIDMK